MESAAASSETTIIDEEQVQQRNEGVKWNNINSRVAIPRDDYRWKKYGQKFNVKMQKNRSYFKCGNKNCRAKKKVDRRPNEPNHMEITYEGEHNHRSSVGSENEEAGISANQYDLATQMFGSRT